MRERNVLHTENSFIRELLTAEDTSSTCRRECIQWSDFSRSAHLGGMEDDLIADREVKR